MAPLDPRFLGAGEAEDAAEPADDCESARDTRPLGVGDADDADPGGGVGVPSERVSGLGAPSCGPSERLRGANTWLATAVSASGGHASNQSMVQCARSAGKRRQRRRKEAPTGDMQSTTWRRARSRAASSARPPSRVSG